MITYYLIVTPVIKGRSVRVIELSCAHEREAMVAAYKLLRSLGDPASGVAVTTLKAMAVIG